MLFSLLYICSNCNISDSFLRAMSFDDIYEYVKFKSGKDHEAIDSKPKEDSRGEGMTTVIEVTE